MSLPSDVISALDRMDTVAICWQAVSDLMNSDGDAIQSEQRDNIAMLIDFLSNEYGVARKALTEAAKH